jgi:hypothetical protein
MADYNVEGKKKVYCNHGHECIVPFKQTTCKCPCGDTFFVEFFGVVIDKNGNYVY